MKKCLLWLLLLLTGIASAQHFCGSDELHRLKMQTDPLYASRLNDFNNKNFNAPATTRREASNYVIPVVVHVMHKGEAVGSGTNISDDKIKLQIRQLNEHYRKIAGSPGDGAGVDVGIEFALAVRDPDGNCTTGIDRFSMTGNTTYMNYGVKHATTGLGITDTALKATRFWDSSQYYNIWVVSEFDNGDSQVGGYAYFASAHGLAYDGAVILSTEIGHPDSVTAAHELGHAFNLYHSFEGDGDGSTCPTGNRCGSDYGDCCGDTAPHKRYTNCNTLTSNECAPTNSDLSYANNYMTYTLVSGCQNMFTPNQKSRIVSALQQIRGSFLAENGNMSLVPPSTSTPSFILYPSLLCAAGQTVGFTNTTPCIPQNYLRESNWPDISFNWTISNGTDTYTLTEQNPEFTPPASGVYNVTLQIELPEGTVLTTLNNALIVGNGGPVAACTPRNGQIGNFAYTINKVELNTISNTTSDVNNEGYRDFSCTNNTRLNAGQTYPLKITARSYSTYQEYYRVYIDYNNNGVMDATEMVASGINPVSSTTTYLHNITIPTSAVRNTFLRMRVIGDASNFTSSRISCTSSFFINDIEDYAVYITGTQGTDDFDKEEFTIVPNPTNNEFVVTANALISDVKVYNLLGQIVKSENINAVSGLVNISHLSSGTYIVAVESNGKVLRQKVVKK